MFPNGGYFSLTNKAQTGTWASIGDGGSIANVTTQMFNLYVRHSPTPTNRTYYYIVAPNKSAGDMTTLYANHGFELASNTATVQAIYHNGTNKQYAAVFYGAGQVTMPDGLVVKSDRKAIVQIKKYSANYRISVSDPEYTGSDIKITLNLNLSGTGTVYSGGETTITFSTFSGDEKGRTSTGFFPIVSGGGGMASIDVTGNNLVQGGNTETFSNDGALVVYPNPATSSVTVDGISKDAKIDVYNVSGQKQKSVTGNVVKIDELPAGVYFLRINDGGKTGQQKFVKH